MVKTSLRLFLLIILSSILVSWGNIGHRNINYKSTASFPATMIGFASWADSLSINGSNADYRKSDDPNESPRHYIDLDNYQEFNNFGRIASTYDSIVNIHGSYFVVSNGTLPWATKIAYDSLKDSFNKRRWHKAMLFASDLGHYVADGHMPLHLTSNYDGRATGQSGIHSRYESTMVSTYLNSLINYGGESVHFINNVNNYIFNYIYKNQLYVDSVLAADKYATNLAKNNFSTEYYSTLWDKTKFTTTLFKNATKALAELIYSAWIESGSPLFGSKLVLGSTDNWFTKAVMFSNPSNGNILFNSDTELVCELYTLSGSKIEIKTNKNFIDLTSLSNGVYLLKIYNEEGLYKTEKLILQK